MPYYLYIARDKTGKRITGREEALNSEELAARLQAQELIVINIIPEIEKTVKTTSPVRSRFIHQHKRITSGDLVLFCQQLHTLLEAGVTILQSLKIIAKQVSSARLNKIIYEIISNMEKGMSLHEAMAEYPDVFSELWLNLIESGEASGNLVEVLKRLSSYLERNAQFQRKVISSLMYPAILLMVGIFALLFLNIKIIPVFAELFKSFNVQLPLLTRILIFVSTIIKKYSIFIFAALVIFIFLLRKVLRTKEARKRWEEILFKLPLAGVFFRSLIIERFSSNMATLLESGVPVLYALEISERSIVNLVAADIIREIKNEVRGGKSLSIPMEKTGFFEPMVVQMVAVGEEIGELPNMFKRINSFYQEYIDTFLTRFTTLFEPLMLIILGGIIGLMVVGIFLPLFQITQIR
ncbi:MAG: type II secretion system F family protein [Candidatus Omnitrophica bacterium]|nr:type II secretion system F family protein [Candidatus Omnitrophota bacterium]